MLINYLLFTQYSGDQDGKRSFPRHVFANPYNPSVCPVLALAVLIFSQDTTAANPTLFPEHVNRQFSHWLKRACQNLPMALNNVTIKVDSTGNCTVC